MIVLKSNSESETIKIAKKLASKLSNKGIVILTGELGSGKTKFVEGFLSYFNLQDEISSPTFNIVNEHLSPKCDIYHFDVYRLENSDEFHSIGGEEYFEKGICLIEWGEIIQDVLPKEYIHITFKKNNNDENLRTLEIKGYGKKYEKVIDSL